MTCQRTLSVVNVAHHYQVKMGLCGHCLGSNSLLETKRANARFLYKKVRVRLSVLYYRVLHTPYTLELLFCLTVEPCPIHIGDKLLQAHRFLQLLQLLSESEYLLGESHSFLNLG